jgi:tetratricopeptide (TPR) repeat protein
VFDTPTLGVTGHGPEGYRTVFGAHVDEEYVIRHGRDVITDRAHNGLLDTTLTGGFLAGVGMVLLQAGLLVTSLQRMRSREPIDVGLSAALIGYLTQQFFLFPLSELDPVLWIFAGLLIARRPQRVEYRPPLFASISGARQGIMLGAGFLAAVGAVAGLSDVAADHAIEDAVAALDGAEPDAPKALKLADEARSRRPDSIRYDFIAARAASLPGALEGFKVSLERLEAGLKTSPTDPMFLEEQALVLLEIARRTSDPADLSLALDVLGLLDASDPNNPRTELAHGFALALDGRTTSGLAELKHAAALDADLGEALLKVAIIHFENGDLESGTAALERMEDLDPSNARAISLRREFPFE